MVNAMAHIGVVIEKLRRSLYPLNEHAFVKAVSGDCCK